MSKSRNACDKARGFSYQRQYAIFLLLENINYKEITDEGNIEGTEFEDITIKKHDGKIITYQIKYHTSKPDGLCISNKDLFKTLKHKNNAVDNVENVFYIVGNYDSNKSVFTRDFIKWSTKKPYDLHIFKDMYNNKIKGKNKENFSEDKKIFSDFCHFIFKKRKDERNKYMNNFIFERGPTYKKLVDDINDKIEHIFGINDEIKLYYIRFKIFDEFEKKWFDDKDNEPVNINDTINKLQLKIKDSKYFDSKKIINLFIELIESYIKYRNNFLLLEMKNFIDVFGKDLTIKNITNLLNIISSLNKKYKNVSNSNINDIHNLLLKKFCFKIFIRRKDDITEDNIDTFISSMNYYNKHNINKEINQKKSKYNWRA